MRQHSPVIGCDWDLIRKACAVCADRGSESKLGTEQQRPIRGRQISVGVALTVRATRRARGARGVHEAR